MRSQPRNKPHQAGSLAGLDHLETVVYCCNRDETTGEAILPHLLRKYNRCGEKATNSLPVLFFCHSRRPRRDSLCVWNVRPLKDAFWIDRPKRLPLYSQAGGAEGRRSRQPKQEGQNCRSAWSTLRIPDKKIIAARLPCSPAGSPQGRAKGSACAMGELN